MKILVILTAPTVAVVGRILDSGGLAAIFARLKSSGHLYLEHFAGKSPGKASRQSGRRGGEHLAGCGGWVSSSGG
jgi:hypothetical protein